MSLPALSLSAFRPIAVFASLNFATPHWNEAPRRRPSITS